MKNWLTIHWPQNEGDKDCLESSGVYIQEGRESALFGMEKGDRVFVYESKTGPKEIGEDGHKKTRRVGRLGLIGIYIVDKIWNDSNPAHIIEYDDRSKRWWKNGASVIGNNGKEFTSTDVVLPRENVVEILGYNKNYYFRGYGIMHSGLKDISESQAEKLEEQFELLRLQKR